MMQENAPNVELSADGDVSLSVITVVRNDAERLDKTIRSMEKFYGDNRFEHIVIDGNSADHTKEILLGSNRYPNFRYFSEEDRGIYDAMNKGILLASGRFLLFLNCGDRIAASPDQIHRWLCTKAMMGMADIICFNSLLDYGDYEIKLSPYIGTLYKMPTSHQAMVFSRKLLCTHPYDIRYRIAADFDLFLKVDRAHVLVCQDTHPLTVVEAKGVASENPVLSYSEYLEIASENLRGVTRWLALARIGSKAAVIIVLKKILPDNWLRALRRYI